MFSSLRKLAKKLSGSDNNPWATTPKATAPAEPSLPQREVRVKRVVRETADAVAIYLEELSGDAPRFQPGQFLNVRVEVAGETLWRSYSICTAPHEGELAVAVKRVEGGRVSTHLNQHVAEGQLLTVRGPSGTFTLPEPTVGQLTLIGGGSGITPLISQAKHVLTTQPDTRVALIYGNRSEADIIFRQQLAQLEQDHPGRFVLRHVLSDGTGELRCARGVLDEPTVRNELAQLSLDLSNSAATMICGPEPMMVAARSALLAMGVPAATIREERFVAPVSRAVADGKGPFEVSVTIEGKVNTFQVPGNETILEAALNAQVPLDFSCGVGACGTCMSRLLEGDVQMMEPNFLTPADRAAKMVLPCIANAKGPCKLEKVG